MVKIRKLLIVKMAEFTGLLKLKIVLFVINILLLNVFISYAHPVLLRVPISDENKKRFEYVYVDTLVRYSSLSGSVIKNELIFNFTGSKIDMFRAFNYKDLKDLQLVAVKSILDLEGKGKLKDMYTLFIIDMNKYGIVGYDFIELKEDSIISYSSKIFDSYRGEGYMERAIKFLLLSGKIKKWVSSSSLENLARRMYRRIANDFRFFVTFLQDSRYSVRLVGEDFNLIRDNYKYTEETFTNL